MFSFGFTRLNLIRAVTYKLPPLSKKYSRLKNKIGNETKLEMKNKIMTLQRKFNFLLQIRDELITNYEFRKNRDIWLLYIAFMAASAEIAIEKIT